MAAQQEEVAAPPAKVTVLGAGSWGTAFAKIAADTAREDKSQRQVVLWGRNSQAMADCREHRINRKYFPDLILPDNLQFSSDLAASVRGGRHPCAGFACPRATAPAHGLPCLD